jgi:hypothetical protein
MGIAMERRGSRYGGSRCFYRKMKMVSVGLLKDGRVIVELTGAAAMDIQ